MKALKQFYVISYNGVELTRIFQTRRAADVAARRFVQAGNPGKVEVLCYTLNSLREKYASPDLGHCGL